MYLHALTNKMVPDTNSLSVEDLPEVATSQNNFEYCLDLMHLSMLSRWGGRPGKGGGFDVTSLPAVGTFDHWPSPGGRNF